MTLFLAMGNSLNRFQGLHPIDVFPHFIRHVLPRGLAGLVVAALFSAAMSSLDSGINSVSSVVITDYYRRLRCQDRTIAAAFHFVDQMKRRQRRVWYHHAINFCMPHVAFDGQRGTNQFAGSG